MNDMEQERKAAAEQQWMERELGVIVQATQEVQDRVVSTKEISAGQLMHEACVSEVYVGEFMDCTDGALRVWSAMPQEVRGKKIYVLEQGAMIFVPRTVGGDSVLVSNHFSRCAAIIVNEARGTLFGHATESDRESIEKLLEGIEGVVDGEHTVLLVLAVAEARDMMYLSDPTGAWTQERVAQLQQAHPTMRISTYRNTDFAPTYIEQYIANEGLPETAVIVKGQELYMIGTALTDEDGVVQQTCTSGAITRIA